MEIIKKTVKVGNSAGVILPKRFLNCEAKITIIKRPVNVKKVILRELDDFLKDIIGIYVFSKNPLEVLAVSHNTEKIIEKEKIRIMIVSLPELRKNLKMKQQLKDKIMSAETIINEHLINEIRKEML